MIKDLQTQWPGLAIINGRPRHPQSQGCVERGNAVLQSKLGKWCEQKKTNAWKNEIKFIVYGMNTTVSTDLATPCTSNLLTSISNHFYLYDNNTLESRTLIAEGSIVQNHPSVHGTEVPDHCVFFRGKVCFAGCSSDFDIHLSLLWTLILIIASVSISNNGTRTDLKNCKINHIKNLKKEKQNFPHCQNATKIVKKIFSNCFHVIFTT